MKNILLKTSIGICLLFNSIFISYGQNISTYAGIGTNGFSGDGGLATSAQFAMTDGIDVDASGNVYVVDEFNHRIRKITPTGTITTIAGTGVAGFSGDGGVATSAQLNSPTGIAIDAAGNIFICDYSNHRIRKISTSGTITTIGGTGVSGFSGDGGVATSAQINLPEGIAVDGSGNIFFADRANNRIRKISSTGTITTIAGTGVAGFSGDGAAATSAQINYPVDTEVDASGNVYFCDASNNRIRKISSTGTITTIAGTGVAGFSGDGGLATSAQLNGPQGVAIDAYGHIYIADIANNRMRKVSSTGTITTIAGTGVAGFSGDGGLATAAAVNYCRRVAVSGGQIYFCDGNNYRIRKITCVAPSVSATSSNSLICVGESVTLSASGASTYTWNPGGNGTTITISPTITSTYSISGTNTLTGCANNTTIVQNVSPCTGINNLSMVQNLELNIYPNPSNGILTISSNNALNFTITNELGQVIFSDKNSTHTSITNLPNGIYFISVSDGINVLRKKLIVIN